MTSWITTDEATRFMGNLLDDRSLLLDVLNNADIFLMRSSPNDMEPGEMHDAWRGLEEAVYNWYNKYGEE